MTTQGRKSPEVPADQGADKDFFHDSERQLVVQQKFGSEITEAPCNPQADSDNPLTKLGDMMHKTDSMQRTPTPVSQSLHLY